VPSSYVGVRAAQLNRQTAMPSSAKSELAIATVAALAGLLVAWWATRSYDDTTPGPAVRLYTSLFRSSGVAKLRDAAENRSRFPRREAFLASWFLTFFVIFCFGVMVWPKVASP
jgi:hypothetical protein